MPITYFSEDVSPPSFKKRLINQWIKDIASTYNKKIGDISYLFCTDEKILEVNNQFLKHNYFTDIITFDYSENNVISGDLLISLDTVRSNADKFGADYKDELYRVIIHGILHLCGLNDTTPGEQDIMTQAENDALIILKNIFQNNKRK